MLNYSKRKRSAASFIICCIRIMERKFHNRKRDTLKLKTKIIYVNIPLKCYFEFFILFKITLQIYKIPYLYEEWEKRNYCAPRSIFSRRASNSSSFLPIFFLGQPVKRRRMRTGTRTRLIAFQNDSWLKTSSAS